MKTEKAIDKIVCDVVGCGKIADYKLIMSTGAVAFICADCADELKKGLKELKKDE